MSKRKIEVKTNRIRIGRATRALPDPGESFSQLASDVLAIVREESNSAIDQAHENGWTPWPSRRFRLRVVGRLARSGWTLRRFVAELERRTSERWVHFGPLGPLEQFAECLLDV